MPQPILELGGDPANPRVMHIAPANGFVPETYLPLLRPFMADYRVVSLPPRVLWGDGQPPPIAPGIDWSQLADDMLAGMRQFALENVVAVGHSFGGIASILAVLQEPRRFRALILLDPTILHPQVIEMIKMAREKNIPIPLAEGALRRRREFGSVQEAFDQFRSRSLFAQWSDEALRLYAEHGTQPTPDGKRTLRWSAEWEAYYFSIGYTATWELVPKLANVLPVLILRGGTSDTYIEESMLRVRDMLPRATHIDIPGHGHLFPQTAPEETARVMQDWLGKLE
jgi:pimeloyl-ACP methyl ester carboxylesterase